MLQLSKLKLYLVTIFLSFVAGFLFNIVLHAYQVNKGDQKIVELEKQNKELFKDINAKDNEIAKNKEELKNLKQINDSDKDKLNKTLIELRNLKNTVNIEKSKSREELIAKVKTIYNSEEISAINISDIKVSEQLMTNIVFDAENWKVNGQVLIDKCKKYDEALNRSIQLNSDKDKIISKQDEIIKLRDDQVSKYMIIINNKDIENSILNKDLKNEKINGNIKLVCGTIGGGALVWLITLL